MIIALVSAGIWLYLLLLRGGFWRVAPPARPLGDRSTASVVAVIPARNEAEGIAPTIASLLGQDHAGPLHIVVVDDHSSDGTADLAREAAARLGQAARLTVMPARPLPAGWTGKLWAVSEGLALAETMHPDFVVLTDADITHAPDNVSTLTVRAERDGLDLASLMVRLHCATFWEKALIPAFVFFFFMLYPPRWTADPMTAGAGAAGGCMLVRPRALARIGGIASIRGALIDDCALARRIKRTGGRISLDVTAETHSTRVYRSASEIWAMIARTAFTQLGYSTALLTLTLIGLAVTYMAPPCLALLGHGWARWLGLAAWIGMALAYRPTLRLYGRAPLWGAALPVIALFYAAATIGSALAYWRGKGGQWKGRSQALS